MLPLTHQKTHPWVKCLYCGHECKNWHMHTYYRLVDGEPDRSKKFRTVECACPKCKVFNCMESIGERPNEDYINPFEK